MEGTGTFIGIFNIITGNNKVGPELHQAHVTLEYRVIRETGLKG
jgi:hypothetical protein